MAQIAKNSNNEEFSSHFKKYKRVYRRVIKAAKAKDIAKKLNETNNFAKTAWNIINDKANHCHPQEVHLKIDGKIVRDPLRVATEFNTFFATVADQGHGSQAHPLFRQRLVNPVADTFILTPVMEHEVARLIERLPSKRTNDCNYMSTWLIKRCYKPILSPLTEMINDSFRSGIFPSSLKLAKVIPIHKKEDLQSLHNYRPISILPVLSKVFEKFFHSQLSKFLESNNLISENQFGFRSGKSTTEAAVSLVDMIVRAFEDRSITIGVFLDLSKAFDCVDHLKMLQKLESYGIRGSPLAWLRSYLGEREQSVYISNSTSSKLTLRFGVPQGSILSPLLFLIYVNDTGSSLQHGDIVQYADDTTLFFRASSPETLELQTFIDLNNCIQNFNDINLRTNTSKSTFINFRLRVREYENKPTVMIDDKPLVETDSFKFLGIYLDRGLTWGDHIDSVCAKVSSGIFVLRKLSKLCHRKVLLMAYYGLIYPHLSYGLMLWGGTSQTNFMRIFRLQKKSVRIISKLSNRESCKPAFKNLKLLTLPCLYILEVTFYFISKGTHLRGRDVHNYNTRGRDDYRTGLHRTVAYENLPLQAGAVFANSLPAHLKTAPLPRMFKNKLKEVLLSEAFYSVGEFLAHDWVDEGFPP